MDTVTQNGRLRQQILSGEQDIDALNGKSPNPQHQQPQFQQHYVQQQHPANYPSNYDLMTPVNAAPAAGNSRKASLTSQSSMSVNRLFRRKVPGAFDDDAGADIGDLTGRNMSFDDITHMRDRGPYGMNSLKTLDTTPIIPTLGAGGIGPASGKTMTNLQYRKQMNHQKKMNLANGARAMSLAGSNPIHQQQQQHPGGDPRAMSFNALGASPNGPRTMSLMNPMAGPRTMSLNSNQNPQQGPRTMSLNNRGPFPGPGGPARMNGQTNQQGPFPAGPRTLSLTNGQYYQQMGPSMGQYPQGQVPGQFQQVPGQYQGQMPGQYYGQVPPGQYTQGMPPQMAGQGGPYNQRPGQKGFPPPRANFAPKFPNQPQQNSTDSLGNVPEEDDEASAQQAKNRAVQYSTFDPRNQQPNGSLPLSADTTQDEDTDDVVYKFDEDGTDSPLISRKSTLKKSNSMRLRKINFFNNGQHVSPAKKTTTSDGVDVSPSFNLKLGGDNRDSILRPDDEDDYNENGNRDKLQSLGATVTASSSASGKDIYVTASNFNSPNKDFDLPSPDVQRKFEGDENTIEQANDETEQDDSPDDHGIRHRGSPVQDKTISSSSSVHSKLKTQTSHKSLVANTAFNNFRSPLSEHTKAYASPPLSGSVSSPFRQFDESNNASRSSFYSENLDLNEVANNHVSQPSTSLTLSRDNTKTPPTANTSNDITHGKVTPTENANITYTPKAQDYIRSTNTSDLMLSPLTDDSFKTDTDNSAKSERPRNSRSFSLTGKSKNLLKRLSKSSRKSSLQHLHDELLDDGSVGEDSTLTLRNGSIGIGGSPLARRRLSSTLSIKTTPLKLPQVPIKFTKNDLAIMNSNSELLNELQLVTAELASSIKRELALENRLKNNNTAYESGNLEHELLTKLKLLNEVQEKLNNERRLRFISEEHAILLENGQSPSPLKLNYEKNEMYKQLIVKNDLVNQLQDKIDELTQHHNKMNGSEDQTLLDKYNELLKENADLKLNVIPGLEKQLSVSNELARPSASRVGSNRQLSLVDSNTTDELISEQFDQSDDQIELLNLRNQREELREVVTKLTSSHSYESKIAQDKIRSLEAKVHHLSAINDKLSRRLELNRNESSPKHANAGGSGNGGKLQGFTIVSPTKRLFDE